MRRCLFAAGSIAAVVVIAVSGSRVVRAADGYVFGVFPFLPPARLGERFGGFSQVFSEALHRPVEFRTRSTFEFFRNEIKKQTYDIVFVQPFDYVVAADKYGYRPIAAAVEPLTAVVMVKPDSPMVNLRDLRAKMLAMPPASAAVSRLTKVALIKAGLDLRSDLKILHVRNHPACLQAVLIGEAAACATNNVPLRIFLSSRKAAFRMLAESEAIPHVLFAAHRRVPKHDRDLMRRAIISLGATVAGKRLLLRSGRPGGYKAVQDKAYDAVRKMCGVLGCE